MDGRPAEDGRNLAFFPMDKDPHAGGYLVVHAAVALEIDQAFRVDIVDKPADLVGMGLDHHFEGRSRVDDAHGRSVRIGKMTVHIRFQVFEPEPLTTAFKTYR